MITRLFAPLILLAALAAFQLLNAGSAGIIQLAWFTKVPKEGSAEQMAKYFDLFVLTKSDEAYRDQLKEKGVQGTFLQYLLFPAIQNPRVKGRPYRNQVADQPGDYERLLKVHPGWFLKDEEGRLLEDDGGYVMMDPANPEWQRFWLDRAIESQEKLGWDGVFLDNVEASTVKREQRNQFPAKYKTEAAYLKAIESFLQFMYQNYFQPQKRPLYANIISIRDRAIWFRYLKHLDGAMYESFAVHWRDYRSPEEWLEHLEWAEQTQKLGKGMILVAQGEKNDLPRQQFAYASYLLIANGRASFRYAHQDHYRDLWAYDNYDLDLGIPKGARYQKDDQTWCRDFEKGRACADPHDHDSEISLH